jgi:hypothetical protein
VLTANATTNIVIVVIIIVIIIIIVVVVVVVVGSDGEAKRFGDVGIDRQRQTAEPTGGGRRRGLSTCG